jgi:hypothetical protein
MFFHLSPSRPPSETIKNLKKSQSPRGRRFLPLFTHLQPPRAGSPCLTQSGQQTIHPYPWRPKATSGRRRRRWCPSRCPRRRGGPRRWVGEFDPLPPLALRCAARLRFGPVALGLNFECVESEGAGAEFERAGVCRPRNCGEFSRGL